MSSCNKSLCSFVRQKGGPAWRRFFGTVSRDVRTITHKQQHQFLQTFEHIYVIDCLLLIVDAL
eukprot:m.91890 g.91890  ORF g.91890 m.91890 type:complete len:63 (-) comp12340_c0_seq1:1268-1456(-)